MPFFHKTTADSVKELSRFRLSIYMSLFTIFLSSLLVFVINYHIQEFASLYRTLQDIKHQKILTVVTVGLEVAQLDHAYSVKPPNAQRAGNDKHFISQYLNDLRRLKKDQLKLIKQYHGPHNLFHRFIGQDVTASLLPPEQIYDFLSTVEALQEIPPEELSNASELFKKIDVMASPKGGLVNEMQRKLAEVSEFNTKVIYIYKSFSLFFIFIIFVLSIFVTLFAIKPALRSLEKEIVKDSEKSIALEKAVKVDELTGLGNRNGLKYLFEKIQHSNTASDLFFMVIDLDKFKPINDSFGHAAGDYLLSSIGKNLKELESADVSLFRLGGDEFACLVKNTSDETHVEKLARKIWWLICADFDYEGELLSVECSIGISKWNAKKKIMSDTLSSLMTQADAAMYHAKNNRKDIYFWQEENNWLF